MTLLTLLQLAGGLAELALDIPQIWAMIEHLRAANHPESASIPAHLLEEIRAEIQRAATDPTNSVWAETHAPE